MTYRITAADLARILRDDPAHKVISDTNPPAQSPPDAYRLTPAQPAKPAPAAQSVILPLPPSVNHYLARTGNGGVYLSPEARNYKAAATLTAQHAGMVMYTCPVAVAMHVYRARRVGDLDNYAKLVLDSLTGIAWGDDAQVVELHAYRRDDASNPRVEVEIRTVQEAQP